MGYYINQDGFGNPLPQRGKAQALINSGAIKLAGPVVFQPNLVCVLEGSSFDAAGYIYSEREMRDFLNTVDRPKLWLIVEEADKLSGFKNS
jgi:hypothetical protein